MTYSPTGYISPLSKKALSIAASMVGQGEFDQQNDSPQIRFWLDQSGFGAQKAPVNWCALWIGYAFLRAQQEGRSVNPLPFDLSLGAKKLVRNIGNAKGGRFLERPQPGAVICWHRGSLPWQGHVELVEAYDVGRMVTLSGNSGPVPSVIKRRAYVAGEWTKRLYRIAAI